MTATLIGCGKEALEEPSGVPEAWREREGRELFSSDAVTATTAKDVTTTERSGNAKALLHIMLLLSEALPQSSTAYPIERDCERMVLPLAVERGEGMVVADSSVGAIASR